MAADGTTTVRFEFVGVKELRRAITDAGKKGPRLLARALRADANLMMNASVGQVPVDFGVLRASHVVERPVVRGSMIEVRFGYGGAASKYALAVHENPRAGHTGGVSQSGQPYRRFARTGSWKFLENPVNRLMPSSPARMAALIERDGLFR